MNLDGSLVKRPKWLRIKEAEDLINEMDNNWIFPELKNPPGRMKKHFIKITWSGKINADLLKGLIIDSNQILNVKSKNRSNRRTNSSF